MTETSGNDTASVFNDQGFINEITKGENLSAGAGLDFAEVNSLKALRLDMETVLDAAIGKGNTSKLDDALAPPTTSFIR